MSGSRTTALLIVAAAHVGVFALLALYRPDIIKKIVAPIEAVQVKEEAPPPEEPPPPPPKEQEIPPYVPPPEVTVAQEAPAPTIQTQSVVQQPAPVIAPPAPPAPVAPPAPAPSGPTQAAQPANSHIFEVSEDDYPPSSLRAEEEGVTTVTVTIGVSGRVETCNVTAPSSFPKLDERTCKIAQTRWRFKPALQAGTPVSSTLTKRIRWQINRK